LSVGRRIFEVVIMGISMAIYHAVFLDLWLGSFESPGIFESTIGYILVGLISLFIAHTIIWSLKRKEEQETVERP